jgi:glycosyltransferase involved in cell wall biosynthesis
MNILLSIHHKLNKNEGAPGVTYQLYQEYEKLGHKASIYSIDDIPSYVPNKLKSLLFPFYLFSYVRKNASKLKLNIIDASSGDAWILSLLSKKNHDTVIITRSHGLEHTVHQALLDQQRQGNVKLSWKYPIYHGGIRLWEVATSFRKADGCLFLNDYDLQYAVTKLKTNEQFSRTISNGLPDYFINLGVTIESISDKETIHIAQVGSYIPRKGILYTAKAMNSILRIYQNVELSFIGTGTSLERVLLDYDPEVHNRIHIISRYNHEELPDLLIGKHILLFPSLAEGFPLVLIEAMACGLLPIATETPGPLMILKDGYNAIIVPPANNESIESSLHAMIGNKERMNQLRSNAYKAAQQYKWSEIAIETIHYYEEIRSKS